MKMGINLKQVDKMSLESIGTGALGSDEENLMKWRKDEPPKNGSTFIADIGMPWSVVASWNGCDENWVYANLQVNMVNGIYNDTYFETEREERIIQWMNLPDIPARSSDERNRH